MGTAPQGGNLKNLASRVQSGDASAEEEFFQRFGPRVRAYAMANSGSADLAEELVQDVIWAVIQALRNAQVRQLEQLPAFVFGTARNLLNDRLRARSREKLDQLAPETEVSRPAVEQHDFERNHAAQQAIRKLEAHERVVLLLSLIDGLNTEEIAAKLGVTPDTVRQRKSRAIRKVTEFLARQSHGTHTRLLGSIGS